MIHSKHIKIALTFALFILMAFSVSAQDELECGDIYEGEADGDTISYELVVEEGDYYLISLTSNDFDALIEVYDEDGDLVYTDDDGGEGLNSLLGIAGEGEYEVVVSSFGGAPEGDYELEVSCAGDCDVVEGELEDETVEFDFEAEEGDTILLSVMSDDFDTYLNLLDEDEDELASDDDSGGNLNSMIVYEIEDDGDYIARVTSFSGEGEGDFLLTLCTDAGDVEVPEGTDELDFEVLECDSSTSGTIDNGYPIIFYLFPAEEGDEVTITLSADDSDLDPYLGLFSMDGFEEGESLLENDDTDGLNSEIEYEIEEGGVYVIGASRYGFADGDSEGDFILEIECD